MVYTVYLKVTVSGFGGYWFTTLCRGITRNYKYEFYGGREGSHVVSCPDRRSSVWARGRSDGLKTSSHAAATGGWRRGRSAGMEAEKGTFRHRPDVGPTVGYLPPAKISRHREAEMFVLLLNEGISNKWWTQCFIRGLSHHYPPPVQHFTY